MTNVYDPPSSHGVDGPDDAAFDPQDALDGVHESILEPEEELGIQWPRFGALIALLLGLTVLGGFKVLFVALAIGGFLVFHEAGHYFLSLIHI